MAMPVATKTWEFLINQSWGGLGTVLADNRDLMLKIKNALINSGVFTSEMVVWGSNNGAGAFGNGDAVDRWAAAANLVWAAAGVNHSWMVLTQGGIHPRSAICIDLNNATSSNATIVISP